MMYGRTVYVSPADGDDNGRGTEDDPFRTITKAIETVMGSTIYLLPYGKKIKTDGDSTDD